MIISHSMPFKWRGHAAKLYLLRNNGSAWGRIVDVIGANWDVNPDGDVYDMADVDALELLAELAIEHPDMVSEAVGWEIE
jgi:hypothetical protein